MTVKRKKSVKLAVSVNSKAKLSVAKLSKKNAKVAKVTFKKNKLTIKGHLRKEKFLLRLQVRRHLSIRQQQRRIKDY